MRIKSFSLLVLLILPLFMGACSGSIEPGIASGSSSKTPTENPDGDGGTGDGSVTVPPEITMLNLKGGDFVPGGKTFKIFYSVVDTSLGFNQSKLEYKREGDNTWKLIADRVSSISGEEVSVDWPVCPQIGDPNCDQFVDATDFRIRITAQGKDDVVSTVTSAATFTIDSTAPTLSETGISVAATFPKNGFVQMILTDVADSSTPIRDVCMKALDATEPTPGDPCWTSIEAYGATSSLSPGPIAVTQYLGFFGGNYDFYIWARDSAGNMTTQTSNNDGVAATLTIKNSNSNLCLQVPGGILSTDLTTLTQTTCADVAEQKFQAMLNTDGTYWLRNQASGLCMNLVGGSAAPGTLIQQATCSSAATNRIKYKVTPNAAVFKILNNGTSGCVSITGGSVAADATVSQANCAVSPAQDFEVTVLDGFFDPAGTGLGNPAYRKDKVSVAYSAPVVGATNGLWNDSVNTDFALATDITTYPTVLHYSNSPVSSETAYADPGSFVMTSKGVAYINDQVQGIIRLDLINQTRSVYIPKAVGPEVYTEGTVGAGATAILKNPLKMAIDEDDELWILDEGRIAHVNSSGQMNTAIGGGTDTNDEVADPLDLQITHHDNMKWYGTFVMLPNKQLVFQSEDPHLPLAPTGVGAPRFRLRVYHGLEAGRIESIVFSGTYSSQDVANFTPYGALGFTYDTTRKYIKEIVGRFCTAEVTTTCSSQVMLKFSAKGKAPELLTTQSLFTNMTVIGTPDSIYAFNAQKGLLSKLDMTTKAWSKVLGGTIRGSSYCNNDSSSTACQVRLTDVYITRSNKVFFLDHSRIRSLEANGLVQTLYEP